MLFDSGAACVRPCERINNEETRHSRHHFSHNTVSSQARHRETCVTGELSGMPVLTEPNLSGGHHIDDNQTAAEQINVIKPITVNQTPLTSPLIWINSRGLRPG